MIEKTPEKFTVAITGPGVSVRQDVTPLVAQRAIALVIGANTQPSHAGADYSTVAEPSTPADDPTDVANLVKSHPDYESLLEPVFLGSNFWKKIAAVLYCSDRPLTGGQISRTLQGLAVKSDPSNVRKYLAIYLKHLIKDKTPSGSVYKLSGVAQSRFLKEVRAHRGD